MNRMALFWTIIILLILVGGLVWLGGRVRQIPVASPGLSNAPTGTNQTSTQQAATTTASSTAYVQAQYEIRSQDNGKSFSYPVTSRFTIFLDMNRYPEAELQTNCSRPAVIGAISNVPAGEPGEWVKRFEGVYSGTCELTDRDWHVAIRITE